VNREAEVAWQRRIGFAQASIRNARSWSGHPELGVIGFAVEKAGRGGRALDIETASLLHLSRMYRSTISVGVRASRVGRSQRAAPRLRRARLGTRFELLAPLSAFNDGRSEPPKEFTLGRCLVTR
jgi:hypothetical protein